MARLYHVLITVSTTEVFVWRRAITGGFIKRIRVQIQTCTHRTHTPSSHCLSCLHKEHPRDHPLLPILHHFYFFSRLQLVSFLSFDSLFLSFFRSLSPAFPSVSRGRTCCRSDMQQHASVTTDSVPVHPFIRSRSFFVHPSSLHLNWSSLLIWQAQRPCVFVARLPQSFVKLRYISTTHSAPVSVAWQTIHLLLCSLVNCVCVCDQTHHI